MTAPASTTSGIVLDGPLAALRERSIRLLHEVADHIGQINAEGIQDKQRLIEAADDLREMFLMVVVIGEFNAGKSTFVNALIGDTVLPMGITPTTDMIELIRFAPVASPKPEVREGAIREWRHPNTGVPGVVIVDTPGTGSVFAKHEQIAKSFLHRSDLVIFVISAKRAFAETERLYLELAKSYGKKIVVVINQMDLLDFREQNEVRSFVMQQIKDLLDLRPPIFLVSAKKSLQSGTGRGGLLSMILGDKDEFGMNAVKSYLRDTFEQVPPAQQKLITQLDYARRTAAKYTAEVQAKLNLIGSDTNAAEDLRREIERQASNLETQLQSTLRDVHQTFEQVKQRGGSFIDKHIRIVRASLRGMDKAALQKEFVTDVIGDTLTRLASTQEHYVNALVDNGRAYWRGVLDRLNKLEALLREEQATMDASVYADQRAAVQSAMALADSEMKAYTNKQVLESLQSTFESDVSRFTYGVISGSLGAIVALFALLTPGAITLHPLAFAGAVIGLPVALIGGGVAVWAWSNAVTKARKQLKDKIDELEVTFKTGLVTLTDSERNRLTQYGHQILAPVFSQLQTLAQRYKAQQAEITVFIERATGIEAEIKAITVVKP